MAGRSRRALRSRTKILFFIILAILVLWLDLFHLSATPVDPVTLFRTEYPYTRTLVMPRTRDSDHRWLHEQLSDVLAPQGNLTLSVYSVDDPTIQPHTPENKGHEAMVYLTYLIDRYGSFPDVSIFVHGGMTEWHNNELVDAGFTAPMLRRLNLDKVMRDGYVNLLCEWRGNCPAHLRPHTEEFDPLKAEESLFADIWPRLFDGERAPDVLAQACCSQFAVSRERLMAVPREKYEHLRDWLIGTELEDHDSGRIFEYVWQYLFAGEAVFCPDPMVCYCEAYGICFARKEEYEEFFSLRRSLDCRKQEFEELDSWDWAGAQFDANEGEIQGLPNYFAPLSDDSVLPLDESGKPIPGLREKLTAMSRDTKTKLTAIWKKATEYGSNSKLRAAAIYARRNATDTLRDGVQCNRDLDAGEIRRGIQSQKINPQR